MKLEQWSLDVPTWLGWGGGLCVWILHTCKSHSHQTIIIANIHPSIHLIRKCCVYKAVLCMFLYKYASTVASVPSVYGEPIQL